ncbi:MAG TPA: ABC transporter ATP-binding protein [Acidimicrobiales bacterium]|nr:ABC transporter ATP-binding protein [Acidimicrobiales bacterium]
MAERIAIDGVDKVYPGGNRALKQVSLAVEPGTFLVLLGPSGSGKTTLLRCLAGIERVTGGSIAIGARVVAGDGVHLPPERRDLSMVFQDYALWPHMVARDNVAFALKRRGVSRAEGRATADAMLTRVGLGKLAERYPSELSGGEQQRVALARALVGDTGLVLCDEPLSNLDADLRERMRIEISSLVRQAGATAIYITHDQSEAFALADKVGVLEKGRLVQLGVPEEIYAAPASPFVARFTGLAGELAVRIRGGDRGDGTVEVEASTRSSVRPFRARVGHSGPTGARGELMIRPTAVRLCAADGDDHHLVGRVADVAFRGRGYEHAVELSCGTQLSNVFAERRVERGESVGLRLEMSGCLVFPGDGAATIGSVETAAGGRPADAPHVESTLAGALQASAVEEVGSWK